MSAATATVEALFVVLCADGEAHGVEWADGPWDAEACVSACDEEAAAARLCEAVNRIAWDVGCGPHRVARFVPTPE